MVPEPIVPAPPEASNSMNWALPFASMAKASLAELLEKFRVITPRLLLPIEYIPVKVCAAPAPATVLVSSSPLVRLPAPSAVNLTNGELDTNTVAGAGAAQTFTGMYSIGNNNRGVMTLNFSSSSAKLAFAMLANGNAQFIEFDASGGAGTIGSGTMEKAETTAYSTARITGDYAFGAAGFDNA